MSGPLESHPAADLFPMLSDMELDRLAADIRDNGLLDAIVLFDGRILDGRNRYAACRRVETEPRFIQYDGQSPVLYVLSKNLHRRQLTVSQRAAIAAESIPMLKEEARKRMLSGKPVDPVLMSGEGCDKGTVTKIVANEVGVGHSTVWEAEQVKNADPEEFARVKKGEVVLHQAYKKVALSKRQAEMAVAMKQSAESDKLPLAERIEQIDGLASQGFRASQIAEEIGISEQRVRQLARENEINLPDIAIGKPQKLDVNRIVGETVIATQGLALGLEFVDTRLDDLDAAQLDGWVDSLKESVAAFNRLIRQLNKRRVTA